MKVTTPEQREYYQNRYKNLYRNNWRSRIIRNLRMAKIRHGSQVTITVDQLLEQLQKQDYKCYYTGKSLETEIPFGRGPKNMSVSLDRLDNTRSYEPGNVVFCLHYVNRAKSNLSWQEFLDMCQDVLKWNELKELRSIESEADLFMTSIGI